MGRNWQNRSRLLFLFSIGFLLCVRGSMNSLNPASIYYAEETIGPTKPLFIPATYQNFGEGFLRIRYSASLDLIQLYTFTTQDHPSLVDPDTYILLAENRRNWLKIDIIMPGVYIACVSETQQDINITLKAYKIEQLRFQRIFYLLIVALISSITLSLIFFLQDKKKISALKSTTTTNRSNVA